MPREHFGPETTFLPRSEILTFEEIARVVEAALPLGLRKVRITGGEPLLRRDIAELIRQLRRYPVELALTTNGHRLATLAESLRRAGLDRVSVSLDALDPELYQQITDTRVSVSRVLEGITRAQQVGLAPVKVNAVIRRNCNEHQILPLIRHFQHLGPIVRFIEFMDVGATNSWERNTVVCSDEILRIIAGDSPIEAIATASFEAVAERWRVVKTGQEVGVISSVSRPFCRGCTRLRLSASGRLHRCLFAADGFDLRPLLRTSASVSELERELRRIWESRDERYSELRGELGKGASRPEMSYLGG